MRLKKKTLKRWKPTETVLNQKIPIATRKLIQSNQLGTSIPFDIANEHNCFKFNYLFALISLSNTLTPFT